MTNFYTGDDTYAALQQPTNVFANPDGTFEVTFTQGMASGAAPIYYEQHISASGVPLTSTPDTLNLPADTTIAINGSGQSIAVSETVSVSNGTSIGTLAVQSAAVGTTNFGAATSFYTNNSAQGSLNPPTNVFANPDGTFEVTFTQSANGASTFYEQHISATGALMGSYTSIALPGSSTIAINATGLSIAVSETVANNVGTLAVQTASPGSTNFGPPTAFYQGSSNLGALEPPTNVFVNPDGSFEAVFFQGSETGNTTLLDQHFNALGIPDATGPTTLNLPPSTTLAINSSGQKIAVSEAVTPSGTGPSASATLSVQPVCFASGTLIRTNRGDVAVEALAVGDLAVTASGNRRPICWTSGKVLSGQDQALPHDQQPIRIRAGAFGRDALGIELPARDLLLSPGHPVLVGADADNEGGHLVPVMCLINGTTIARVAVATVKYWHVELDAHDILLAEGLPAESYLDWGDRAFFTDGADYALANPDFVVPGVAARCRPVALDGPVVEAERQRLDAVFAAALAVHADWDEAEVFASR